MQVDTTIVRAVPQIQTILFKTVQFYIPNSNFRQFCQIEGVFFIDVDIFSAYLFVPVKYILIFVSGL